jgi:hypothetical protein
MPITAIRTSGLAELLTITATTSSTSTSVANHGAVATPSIGGNFTTTALHPNVDIEVSCPYVYASVNSVPSFHVMIDGSADANCQGEGDAYCAANVTGHSVYRKFRLFGLVAQSHTLAIFIKNSTAGTATLLASSTNPIFVHVVEAP